MSTLIGKQFALYDVPNMPSSEVMSGGKAVRYRKILVSPYTTGEPIMIFRTTYYADPGAPLMSAEELAAVDHHHEYAEEIMLFDRDVQVAADGQVFDLPAGGAFVAKAGCRHSCQFVDKTQDGTITCIFVPSIPADEDPAYVELIQRTKDYLSGPDTIRL